MSALNEPGSFLDNCKRLCHGCSNFPPTLRHLFSFANLARGFSRRRTTEKAGKGKGKQGAGILTTDECLLVTRGMTIKHALQKNLFDLWTSCVGFFCKFTFLEPNVV